MGGRRGSGQPRSAIPASITATARLCPPRARRGTRGPSRPRCGRRRGRSAARGHLRLRWAGGHRHKLGGAARGGPRSPQLHPAQLPSLLFLPPSLPPGRSGGRPPALLSPRGRRGGGRGSIAAPSPLAPLHALLQAPGRAAPNKERRQRRRRGSISDTYRWGRAGGGRGAGAGGEGGREGRGEGWGSDPGGRPHPSPPSLPPAAAAATDLEPAGIKPCPVSTHPSIPPRRPSWGSPVARRGAEGAGAACPHRGEQGWGSLPEHPRPPRGHPRASPAAALGHPPRVSVFREGARGSPRAMDFFLAKLRVFSWKNRQAGAAG